MAISSFLGQALTDPATGLPNLPYFSLVHDWEHRRSRRRDYAVKVVALRVRGTPDRTLPWHLCQELRTSDLVASEGRHSYRVLLTSPDAENAGAVTERIRRMIDKLNEKLGAHTLEADLSIEPDVEPEGSPGPWGPCNRPADP